MKRHIPNFLTLCNLVCGCLAVFYAISAAIFGDCFDLPLYFILAAASFDFLDGLAARLLHACSELGKQLDSLADLVSFGVAPASIVIAVLFRSGIPEYLQITGILIPVFSALRLAKFNIDTRQTTSFIGMPVPANALFWAGLAFSYNKFFSEQPCLLMALVLLFSLLLVSKLPMFSLKMKNLSWRDNKTQYIFLIGCVALLIAFRQNAIAYFIVWYLLLSIVKFVFKLN